MNMRGFRTDLAMESMGERSVPCEGVCMQRQETGGIELTRICVESDAAARELGKPCGEYVTLSCAELPRGDAAIQRTLADRLTEALARMVPAQGEALVVGLGNRNITADSLGTRVVERMLVTRHLRASLEENMRGKLRGVSAIAPGVLGLTGIETAELCRGLVDHVKPSVVIAIDALAALDSARICTTIQLTDTGIEPGSGVGNHRMGLTRETLGVPVVAIGVPMVVYAATLARDALRHATQKLYTESENEQLGSLFEQMGHSLLGEMVVTPREIDEVVLRLSEIIARGVNRALQPALEDSEIGVYMHQ